mgnify:CR=1 FL=1
MPSQLITVSYGELIRTTLEHYWRGCAKPIQITLASSGNLLSHKLQTLIKTRLPVTDQLLMHRFRGARIRGLMAARGGDLVRAEQLFVAARALLELNKLSPEGTLLYKSFQQKAESYLDYLRGDFDQARKRTTEALEINVVLEEEYGYELLFLDRIQLVHNLVRIDARCMCFERAIELACQILSYLEGASKVLSNPDLRGYEFVAHQSPELVAAMFAQVTSEIALILAGKNRQVDRDLFAVASTNLQLQTNSNCHCHPRSYAWLLVKQAFVSNDIVMFLERASHFLAGGRSDTPLLWYATVIDLVALCKELDLPDSEFVKQVIAKEAASWEYLPQKFFPLLGVCPKT